MQSIVSLIERYAAQECIKPFAQAQIPIRFRLGIYGFNAFEEIMSSF